MSVVGAIEDIIQGLNREVGEDMAMTGNVVDVEGSEDEFLVDAKAA